MVISYKKKINKKLIIFGVGGHCKVVIDAAKLNGIQIKGIITDLFKSKKHQIDYTYSKDECRALKEKLQLDDLLNLIVCGSIVLNDNQNYNAVVQRLKFSFLFLKIYHYLFPLYFLFVE